jgi:PAS domain-containing protein
VVVASHWMLRQGSEGNPSVVFEINNDITAQKAVGAALRDNANSLRLALDASALGYWYLEKASEGWLTICDERCKSMFGLAASDPLDYTTWVGMMHPDDRDNAMAGRGRASDPDDPHDVYASEYRVIRPNGQVMRVAITGRALFLPDPEAPSGRRIRNTWGRCATSPKSVVRSKTSASVPTP